MKNILKIFIFLNLFLNSSITVFAADEVNISAALQNSNQTIENAENTSILNKIKNNKGKIIAALGVIGSALGLFFRGMNLSNKHKSILSGIKTKISKFPFVRIVGYKTTSDIACDSCHLNCNQILKAGSDFKVTLYEKQLARGKQKFVLFSKSKCCNYRNFICMRCYKQTLKNVDDKQIDFFACPCCNVKLSLEHYKFFNNIVKSNDDKIKNDIRESNRDEWFNFEDEFKEVDSFYSKDLEQEYKKNFKENLNIFDKTILSCYEKLEQHKKEIAIGAGATAVVVSIGGLIYYLYKKGYFKKKPKLVDELDSSLDLEDIDLDSNDISTSKKSSNQSKEDDLDDLLDYDDDFDI